jgi:hypothetical protein
MSARAETRVIRAEGTDSLPAWQGEFVYGGLAQRHWACVAHAAEALDRVRLLLFSPSWIIGSRAALATMGAA